MTMTNNYFDQIWSVTSVDEARAISEEFLKSLFAGASFDEATNKLEDFLPAVSGSEREMLMQLIALRRRQSNISEAKIALLRQLAEGLQDADEGAIDSLTCDFYADAAPLVEDERRLGEELEQLTLKGQQTVQERAAASQ